jgi:hypothetical protein
VEQFLDAASIASIVNGWTPDQTLAIARLRPGGAANDYIRANESFATTSWDHLKCALAKRFRLRIPRHALELKFIGCIQKRGESVSEYATRLRLLGRQIEQTFSATPDAAKGETKKSIEERIFHQLMSRL